MACENNYEVLTLVLRGNAEILHKRYTEDSRKEEIFGDVISINADDFSYQTDEVVLKRIDEFIM